MRSHQGIFSQPIYGDGDYPQNVLDTIPASILPRLTAEDKALIKGSADFYAIDAYRTKCVTIVHQPSTLIKL